MFRNLCVRPDRQQGQIDPNLPAMIGFEPDGRMFPNTDSSQTIIDTLLQAAQNAKVQIRFRSKVERVSMVEEQAEGEEEEEKERQTQFCVSVQTKSKTSGDALSSTTTEEMYFDAVILATGSTPAGYRIVQGLKNHSLVPTVPSLFTLNVAHDEIHATSGLLHELAGISVPWAEVSFFRPTLTDEEGKEENDDDTKNNKKKNNKKKNASSTKPMQTQQGPLLITHHGLSGPAILRLSAFGARDLAHVKYKGRLCIKWAPDLGTTQDIFENLWSCTISRPKRKVVSQCPLSLPGDPTTSALPKRLWASLVHKVGFLDGQTWAMANKKLVRQLAQLINECYVEIIGKSTYKDEFVTAGGVALSNMDMKTMQSKHCPGLFFCGELINVDGVTGGYNFLNCWSTGYVAGHSAAEYVLQRRTRKIDP